MMERQLPFCSCRSVSTGVHGNQNVERLLYCCAQPLILHTDFRFVTVCRMSLLTGQPYPGKVTGPSVGIMLASALHSHPFWEATMNAEIPYALLTSSA